MNKRFISPDWRTLRKFPATLQAAYFYLWDKCDAAGVYEFDEDYMKLDLGLDEPISKLELATLPNIIILPGGQLFISDFVLVNNGELQGRSYNPHKPIYRSIDKYNLHKYFENPSLPQASPKLVGVDVGKEEGVDLGKGGVGEKPFLDPEIKNPFSPEFLAGIWATWKQHRKDKKVPLKSVTSENTSLKHLHKLAGGSEQVATGMLEKAISNGWQGFDYAAPDKPSQNGHQAGARPQTENQRLNEIARSGGHLKIDENNRVKVVGSIMQGSMQLDSDGNMVMYCGPEVLRIYPNEGYRSNKLYEVQYGRTIQQVHEYLKQQEAAKLKTA